MTQRIMAFFDTKPYDRSFFQDAADRAGLDVRFFEDHLTPQTTILAKGCDCVCVFVNDTLDSDVIERLFRQGIGLVALRCAGYNNVDLEAARGKVRVVRVPAYSPHAVAEHTLALIMTLNRKTHRAFNRTHENNFSLNGLLGYDLHGKTLGVIGTGKIGKTFITIMQGFGMRILAHDPYPDDSLSTSVGVEYTDLMTLYRESNIISLHCPLTPQNEHLINVDSIECMKDGVVIINTGRGKLINTADLLQGLKTGKIGAAGLDVYEEEGDYFFEDLSNSFISDDVLARLLTFPNVLVTSHQAFFTREALQNIADTTVANAMSYFAGESLSNEICYRCGATPCPRKAQEIDKVV